MCNLFRQKLTESRVLYFDWGFNHHMEGLVLSDAQHSEATVINQDIEQSGWTGFFEFGLVIIQDQGAIQYLSKNGYGSMRILHEGSTLKRAKGGKKSKGTDLGTTLDAEEVHEAASFRMKDTKNTVETCFESGSATASFDLSLSEEEAIYLVQKKQLTVIDRAASVELPLNSLYDIFSTSRGRRLFALQYAVYSFFKDRR